MYLRYTPHEATGPAVAGEPGPVTAVGPGNAEGTARQSALAAHLAFRAAVLDVSGYTTAAVTEDCTVTASFVLPGNNPPTGVADTFSVPAGSAATTLDVLANDSSAPDTNETLTVESVTQPAQGGTVSVAPNGTGVVFTPEPGFTGVGTSSPSI